VKWLITGGAGFIGCNAARRLMSEGHEVVVFDNLSRKGTAGNLEWLRTQGEVAFVRGDVRDAGAVAAALTEHRDADVVLHLAAQVAVTTSVTDPRTDFEINALGTFNVCEAVRQQAPEAILLNASTNKVYGHMPEVEVVQRGRCYAYADLPNGVPESQPLDFHSPYGCSKGTADQYVRDYARIYGLRTVNFRQSCIYGTRQFGVEDQGWVAWFTIAATLERPITIYGDGRQVRDILWVEDLVECYLQAVARIETAQGQCFNVGGGPRNVLSLLELISALEELLGRKIALTYADWRPGDQRVFVADVRKACEELGWAPATGKYDGIRKLAEWVGANRDLFQDA
jgi:CDP-paratose 2-epimerase